jgi:hypothetical protein
MAQGTVEIVFINNAGSGFADKVSVSTLTTVAEFFKHKLPSARPEDYVIRLTRGGNKYTPAGTEIFQEGDRLSVLPKKVEGA